eukprot:scaffold57215_cov20-Tisochrysis_lutea.AAC.1
MQLSDALVFRGAMLAGSMLPGKGGDGQGRMQYCVMNLFALLHALAPIVQAPIGTFCGGAHAACSVFRGAVAAATVHSLLAVVPHNGCNSSSRGVVAAATLLSLLAAVPCNGCVQTVANSVAAYITWCCALAIDCVQAVGVDASYLITYAPRPHPLWIRDPWCAVQSHIIFHTPYVLSGSCSRLDLIQAAEECVTH